MNFQTTILDPISATLVQLAEYLPAILGALLILMIGWIIAKLIQRVVTNLLTLIRIDAAAEHAGLTTFLRKGEIKESASDLLGKLVYWLIMLIVLVTAVNALGLTTASQLLDKVFLYVPNVIAAVFVIILGTFLAAIVSGIVLTGSANAGLKNAKLIADSSRIAIIVFASIIALDQLGIETNLLVSTFSIIVAGIALAFGIAVGLGAKDQVAKYLNDKIESKEKK